MTTPRHAPVLLDRVVALLAPALDAPGSVYVDCTLGLGGHSEAVLERLPQARVIGIDRDPTALEMSTERLASHGDRFTAVHAVYDELPEVIGSLGLDHVDAIFFDLGVSSMQLDVRDRGFAYAEDAPLDMRMDPTTGHTAADLLNTATPQELTRILREYGVPVRGSSRRAARPGRRWCGTASSRGGVRPRGRSCWRTSPRRTRAGSG